MSNTTTTDFHHHHPSPPTTTPTTTTTSPDPTTATTPESRLAAALGRAFLNIPPSSFPPSSTTTNPLIRTISDADSSPNQPIPITTTPPKVPRNHNNNNNNNINNTPLRRTVSDFVSPRTHKSATKNPVRRTLSDPVESPQPPLKTQRINSLSPQSSAGKQTSQSQVISKKVEEMVREIEQRCWEIFSEEENVEDETPEPEPQEQDECVGVERLKDGDIRFELGCSCGKRFEMLIKHNGYCFYRLT